GQSASRPSTAVFPFPGDLFACSSKHNTPGNQPCQAIIQVSIVASAMSYRQKVDLMVELHKKRNPKYGGTASLHTIRRALFTAEEFRNRIVHSFWAIECGETDRWVRIKASLRGKSGLNIISKNAEYLDFEECDKALMKIREWMIASEEGLVSAIQILEKAEEEIEKGA
ncbi:MAG: hypothetical protein WAW39_06410, partial [Prosthecobacter sp.]|uniref:hypothetical protein n=1 Tax=Prosthecobacter sp. TaxID=1965333 RepID=UPI003BAF7005